MLTIHDPVIFKRWPGSHDEKGRVIGKTYGRPPVRYDIETAGGDVVQGITSAVLDDEAMNEIRKAEGVL